MLKKKFFTILIIIISLWNIDKAFSLEKIKYIAAVNQIRIRNTPSLKGKIIGTIKEGVVINYLNKKSSFKRWRIKG